MLSQLFSRLDTLLYQQRHFWQRQPFHCAQLNAQTDLPESLIRALEDLDPDDFYRLSGDTEAGRHWLSSWIPSLAELDELERTLPTVSAEELQTPVDKTYQHLATGIPGRKWQQIMQFSQALSFQHPGNRLLEWCAGKGHLGRLISVQHQQQVLSLEWQQSLCQQGEALVREQQQKLPNMHQHFRQGDALSPQAGELLKEIQSVVALHACGDLHTQLIRHCRQLAHPEQIAIAPCCYHLTEDTQYQPLSRAGQASALPLSRQDLKIPLQETVTGGQRIERLRDQELHWRLSFDSLRQTLTGEPGYRSLPGFKKQLLSGSFRDFVCWAVVNRQLATEQQLAENTCDWLAETHLQQALQSGAQRLLTVRKLEWLQRPFRRPLELWLVLDRALALEEAGFHVELRQFCDKTITPRNLLILARKR